MSRHQPSTGFTVVELAVVVAILGLLVALTLPVLSNVRQISQQTQCLTNLRQIICGFQLYTGDNNGTLPVMTAGTGSWEQGPWFPQLLKDYLPDPKVWNCPSQPIDRYFGITQKPWQTKRYAWYIPCYSINSLLAGKRLTGAMNTPVGAYQILLADGKATFWDQASIDSDTYVSPIHRSGISVLFLDGHAERTTKSNISVSNNPAYSGSNSQPPQRVITLKSITP